MLRLLTNAALCIILLLERLFNMKEDNINIAIAEYVGWMNIRGNDEKADCLFFIPTIIGDFNGRHGMPVPNYYGDLNAMNLAELWLKKDDPHSYACYVTDLMDGEAEAISKSAAERAEMFVKVIGKYED